MGGEWCGGGRDGRMVRVEHSSGWVVGGGVVVGRWQ